MKNDYISIMQRNENMCLAYILKAEEERQKNNGPSEAECIYLQEAAKLRAEMARMSSGAERSHQEQKKRELDSMVGRVASELGLLKKAKEEKASPDKNKNSNAEKQKSDDGISDETVQSWFVDDTSHGFEAVDGMKDTVEKLRSCIAETKHARLRSYLKMSNTHGFLLYGPPGCGKTYIATAFAHELLDKDYKFMKLKGADILSKYVGEAERTIDRVFKEAIKNAPCIVFVDEIESLCRNRNQELPAYATSITTSFLTGYNEIVDRPCGDNKDGGEELKDKTIIFIGATNYPSKVDDAMVDRMELIRISLPDREARASAFAHKLKKIIKLADDISFEDMAEATEGYNRRDIDRLVEAMMVIILRELGDYDDETAIEMLENGDFVLTQAIFEDARAGCIPSPKDLKELDEWEQRILNERNL